VFPELFLCLSTSFSVRTSPCTKIVYPVFTAGRTDNTHGTSPMSLIHPNIPEECIRGTSVPCLSGHSTLILKAINYPALSLETLAQLLIQLRL
jgi:hypothetical protein